MADWMKDELIDLQRKRIQTLEKEHDEELKKLSFVLGEIVAELTNDNDAIKETKSGPMCEHNIRVVLLQLRDRNVPNTLGWHRYHGLKTRGEK